MKPTIHSFAPLVGKNARILILGSMPGEASIAANRYYAHPRNTFWPIMAGLLNFSPELAYEQKTARLEASGIALWDVLYSCHREGSLDSEIRQEIPNDIVGLLKKQPGIRHIFFNGGKAEQSFRHHVLPALSKPLPELIRLPSTSPAYAALTMAEKYRDWQRIADTLIVNGR